MYLMQGDPAAGDQWIREYLKEHPDATIRLTINRQRLSPTGQPEWDPHQWLCTVEWVDGKMTLEQLSSGLAGQVSTPQQVKPGEPLAARITVVGASDGSGTEVLGTVFWANGEGADLLNTLGIPGSEKVSRLLQVATDAMGVSPERMARINRMAKEWLAVPGAMLRVVVRTPDDTTTLFDACWGRTPAKAAAFMSALDPALKKAAQLMPPKLRLSIYAVLESTGPENYEWSEEFGFESARIAAGYLNRNQSDPAPGLVENTEPALLSASAGDDVARKWLVEHPDGRVRLRYFDGSPLPWRNGRAFGIGGHGLYLGECDWSEDETLASVVQRGWAKDSPNLISPKAEKRVVILAGDPDGSGDPSKMEQSLAVVGMDIPLPIWALSEFGDTPGPVAAADEPPPDVPTVRKTTWWPGKLLEFLDQRGKARGNDFHHLTREVVLNWAYRNGFDDGSDEAKAVRKELLTERHTDGRARVAADIRDLLRRIEAVIDPQHLIGGSVDANTLNDLHNMISAGFYQFLREAWDCGELDSAPRGSIGERLRDELEKRWGPDTYIKVRQSKSHAPALEVVSDWFRGQDEGTRQAAVWEALGAISKPGDPRVQFVFVDTLAEAAEVGRRF